MPRSVHASAPGKVILMGEHAVVYGSPALAAALGLRVDAFLELGGRSVELELESLAYRCSCSWREIVAYREEKHAAWEAFARGEIADFHLVRGKDPSHVVKVALGGVVAELGLEAPPALRIVVRSELPTGSGFGSSAAVAVAVVAGALQLLGNGADEACVVKLALDAERLQHGHPSGIDHHTVLRGGVVQFRGGSEPVAVGLGRWVERDLAIYDTGMPAENTGQVVAAVRRRRDSAPEAFDRMLDRMRKNVEVFREHLQDDAPAPGPVREVIADYQRCLELLGVVPASVSEALRRLAGIGAAGKISGAGGLSGNRAGCLLVYRRPALGGGVDELLSQYAAVRAPIGAPGLAIEEEA